MFLILLGFCFAPTEVEILHYLSRKVKGENLPEGVILDIDIYGQTPWDILKKEDRWHTSSNDKCQFVIYVFTKLKKIGDKKRVVRRTGCGIWDDQNKPEKIYNGHKQLIGFNKMLAFEANVKKDEWSIMPRGHWTMHEYSLGGVSLDGLKVSKEENPSRKKKKMRYDHDEAFTSTPQKTLTLKDHLELLLTPVTSSDFQPLPSYYDGNLLLQRLPIFSYCYHMMMISEQ
ncbi:NAC domain-containing protein 40-like [Cornus florida]|uniref:NAC domain-containing protein 40-like n=1 Tax=Cornus florida TaxID=4283 RepID=UPI00289DEFAC|nr:NAC domain-containing protein 40-like [Cornus florida]